MPPHVALCYGIERNVFNFSLTVWEEILPLEFLFFSPLPLARMALIRVAWVPEGPWGGKVLVWNALF